MQARAGRVHSARIIRVQFVRLCAAGYDSWCTVHHAELCQMSKLGKLQHLRLIECFNGCVDHSLGAALATMTGAPSLQSHWPAKLPLKRLAGMYSPAPSQHL